MAPMWDRIDPLAEKYYGISPYANCGGDPVNFGDYDGMETYKTGKLPYYFDPDYDEILLPELTCTPAPQPAPAPCPEPTPQPTISQWNGPAVQSFERQEDASIRDAISTINSIVSYPSTYLKSLDAKVGKWNNCQLSITGQVVKTNNKPIANQPFKVLNKSSRVPKIPINKITKVTKATSCLGPISHVTNAVLWITADGKERWKVAGGWVGGSFGTAVGLALGSESGP